ncbi:hypothetical protein J2778_003796 [Paraburkholderia graminis]|uniref:hypothetical protein n=1 Tax=Paraburkholderia graminis TaxID=60548 RepID=UPI002861BA3C|nr:hypothetical protein [Paraburkholderia graminis]MDR6476296.1 hypothetical protein [Paraburkholderia graminis]
MTTALHSLLTLREETILKILAEGEWMGEDTVPADVAGWQQRGWIFGVEAEGHLYYARYQFDDRGQPLPVIRQILAELGHTTDPWAIAAWFHFPNGWLVEDGCTAPIAPRDALDHHVAVVDAARRFRGTFEA